MKQEMLPNELISVYTLKRQEMCFCTQILEKNLFFLPRTLWLPNVPQYNCQTILLDFHKNPAKLYKNLPEFLSLRII